MNVKLLKKFRKSYKWHWSLVSEEWEVYDLKNKKVVYYTRIAEAIKFMLSGDYYYGYHNNKKVIKYNEKINDREDRIRFYKGLKKIKDEKENSSQFYISI